MVANFDTYKQALDYVKSLGGSVRSRIRDWDEEWDESWQGEEGDFMIEERYDWSKK